MASIANGPVKSIERRSSQGDTAEDAKDDLIISNMLDILQTFAYKLSEMDELKKIQENFLKEVIPHKELRSQLSHFFSKHVHPESKILKLLKLINQLILAPPYLSLKNIFGAIDCPITDVSGFYFIKVVFRKDEVMVFHIKKSKSMSENPEDYFEFVWNLQIRAGEDISHLKEVNFSLSDIKFHENMKESKKKKIIGIKSNPIFMQ